MSFASHSAHLPVPGPVLGMGDFSRALPGHSCQAPKPRFLGYAVARAYRMIELFQGTDDTVVTLRSRLKLDDPQNLDFDGLSLDDFGAVTFGLFAHALARAAQPNALIGDPGGCVIDSNTFLSQVSLSQKTLDTFLSTHSLTFDEFRRHITGGEGWSRSEFTDRTTSAGFATDFRTFRHYPLMNLGAGQHLILDVQFLEELPASGLFFQILTRLDTGQRKVLLDLWGRIFELLAIELFRHFYPPTPAPLVSPFLADYPFKGGPSDGLNEGQVDGLLDFGKEVVLFEFKHILLSQEVKDFLNRARLETELRLKLVEEGDGKPKAVRQLAKLAAAVRTGADSHLRWGKQHSGREGCVVPGRGRSRRRDGSLRRELVAERHLPAAYGRNRGWGSAVDRHVNPGVGGGTCAH